MRSLIGIHTTVIDRNDNLIKDDTVYGELEKGSLVDVRNSLETELDRGVQSGIVDSYALVVFDVKEVTSQSNDDDDNKDKKP